MPKKPEEPEAAPSADVTENEEENVAVQPQPKPKGEVLPPVIEQVENHETVPAWFKPFGDQLTAIGEALKPKSVEPKPTEPKPVEPKQPESEVFNDKTQRQPKSKSKIKLWRTL